MQHIKICIHRCAKSYMFMAHAVCRVPPLIAIITCTVKRAVVISFITCMWREPQRQLSAFALWTAPPVIAFSTCTVKSLPYNRIHCKLACTLKSATSDSFHCMHCVGLPHWSFKATAVVINIHQLSKTTSKPIHSVNTRCGILYVHIRTSQPLARHVIILCCPWKIVNVNPWIKVNTNTPKCVISIHFSQFLRLWWYSKSRLASPDIQGGTIKGRHQKLVINSQGVSKLWQR